MLLSRHLGLRHRHFRNRRSLLAIRGLLGGSSGSSLRQYISCRKPEVQEQLQSLRKWV